MFLRKAALALALLTVAPGIAAAQVSFGPGGGIMVAPVSGSSPMQLLRRPDVQTHLRLTIRQKDTLFPKDGQGERLAIRVNRSDDDSEEDARKQVEDQVTAHRDAQEAKIRKALRPEQQKRLKELSLQWRGYLALGDPKAAKPFDLTDEQQAEIGRIIGEYNRKKGDILRELMEEKTETPQEGQVIKSVRMNTEKLDNPLSPHRKRLDAARAEAEKQISAALTDAQKRDFRAAQGQPFLFRKDLPGGWM